VRVPAERSEQMENLQPQLDLDARKASAEPGGCRKRRARQGPDARREKP